ncbi:MAG: regulatory protein GemA [Proteobacteria bacterium]|nr:regulatory protein GemA [Pseudomonadota bacterium]MBU1059089.1 regulatory protein GemA [Pseudomonadota bacterium]
MAPDRAELAKIHIAKKQLGLSDDAYRDVLQMRYKKDSAAKLSSAQARNLVDHFKALGFRVKRKKSSKTSPQYDDGQMRRVVALWITLGNEGVVKNKSDQALQKYVKRMTGKDNLRWCDGGDLDRIIESLKKWAKREDIELE